MARCSDHRGLSRRDLRPGPGRLRQWAGYLFLICSGILVAVSLLKPHVHTADSEKLVWGSPLDAVRGRLSFGVMDYRIISGVLFAVMVLLYLIFA